MNKAVVAGALALAVVGVPASPVSSATVSGTASGLLPVTSITVNGNGAGRVYDGVGRWHLLSMSLVTTGSGKKASATITISVDRMPAAHGERPVVAVAARARRDRGRRAYRYLAEGPVPGSVDHAVATGHTRPADVVPYVVSRIIWPG